MPENPTANQSEASRRNGSLSHGPATASGRSRSSLNRLSLGLCSKKIVLPGESQEDFDALLDSFVQEHNPQGITEEKLVGEMAIAAWRLERVRAAEAGFLENVGFATALDDEKSERKLAIFHRYETQYRRMFDSALKLLLQLRAAAMKAKQAESAFREREYKLRERYSKFVLAGSQSGRVQLQRYALDLFSKPYASVRNEPERAPAAEEPAATAAAA